YAGSGERWTFYEIDAGVERIARDPRLFTHLRDVRGSVDVIVRDGRLGITDAATGEYDLIFLDAFSSDAVPVHLLTREAIETYFRKLRPGGIVIFHLSNRYLALAPALGATLHAAGNSGAMRAATATREEAATGVFSSVWAAAGRDAS